MMDFVAGAEIPEHYAPFLMESCRCPALTQAAGLVIAEADRRGREAAGGGDRRRDVGAAGRHPAAAGRHSFTIVEKNADVGGTWFENSYPDCRVDNPSHLYSYSFEPNHEWPNHFSPQPVLLAYFRNVAKKHGLRAHIRFETQVESRVRRGERPGKSVSATPPARPTP